MRTLRGMITLAAVGLCLCGGESNAVADVNTKGEQGINALGLGLTGNGIAIGQIERERVGMNPPDSWNFISSAIDPFAVFQVMLPAVQDTLVDVHSAHATAVAGVMISDPHVLASVAPGAILWSSSLYDSTFHPVNYPAYPEANWAITGVGVALLNNGNVPIINVSDFDVSPWPNPIAVLDGQSFATRALDFTARFHDVLFVVAKGNEPDQFGPPSDMYNGLVVGGSQADANGVFSEVWPDTNFDTAINGRRLIDLIAPASEQVSMLLDVAQGQPNPLQQARLGGTSLATPHASGVAALLHEYANNQQWGVDARRHEVIKAVLMNSADKIRGDGDDFTNFLCMERSIEDTGGHNWLVSDAYTDNTIPLHSEMGAGHLNAKRALKQFEPGQQSHTQTTVPLIGWSYDTANTSSVHKYVMDKPLANDSFISIMLVWNRFVDVANYTASDVTNMQLYLLPKGASGLQDAVASSVSTIYNVEHVFFQIDAEGEYEIWVAQADSPDGPQPYALAWWAIESRGDCPADLNGDGVVDVSDMTLLLAAWGPDRCGYPADLTGDGVVDVSDMNKLLAAWGPCDGGLGACCVDEDCTMETEEDCHAKGGTFLGPTVHCSSNPCELLEGCDTCESSQVQISFSVTLERSLIDCGNCDEHTGCAGVACVRTTSGSVVASQVDAVIWASPTNEDYVASVECVTLEGVPHWSVVVSGVVSGGCPAYPGAASCRPTFFNGQHFIAGTVEIPVYSECPSGSASSTVTTFHVICFDPNDGSAQCTISTTVSISTL